MTSEKNASKIETQLQFRVARFFLAQHSKTGKIYQNDHKIYEMAVK
jgi:hypothetical protein